MGKKFSEIGLDKSVQHIGVLLEKYDTANYPKYELPKGLKFSTYKAGIENEWAQLQYEVEQMDSLEQGRTEFAKCFLNRYDDMMQRCIFVLNQEDKLIGTGSMWDGTTFGDVRQRIHWGAVSPTYQGGGICCALITKALDIYNKLGYKGYIYIASQTWSYKAINIYKKFGFEPYYGKKPQKWIARNLVSGKFEPWNYEEKNEEAWKIINEKIDLYERQKK